MGPDQIATTTAIIKEKFDCMSTAMSMMHFTITVYAGQNTEHFIMS